MLYIYILILEYNKYYIGETIYSDLKFDSSIFNNEWTEKYKPIKIHALIDDCDFYDKYKYIFKYIEKEGIDNLRSDSFPQIELSNEQHKLIDLIKNGFDNNNIDNRVVQTLEFFKGVNDEKI